MPITFSLNLTPRLPALAPPGSPTGIIGRDPWQTVRLGGDVMPGAWKVTMGQVTLKRDPKAKPGADGANPVYQGINLGRFEIEGEQHTDDERDALMAICAKKLPQPGQSKDQLPMLLSHPSVAIFGFPIFVKVIGGSILEYVRPGVTKTKIYLDHWMRPRSDAQSATQVYTRGTRNALRDKKEQQQPSNPPPMSQPGVAGPPANFTPGP